MLPNRAKCRLILSRRGRWAKLAKEDDIPQEILPHLVHISDRLCGSTGHLVLRSVVKNKIATQLTARELQHLHVYLSIYLFAYLIIR